MTAESSELSTGLTCVGHNREEACVGQETAVGSSWRESAPLLECECTSPSAGHPPATERLQDGEGLYPSFLPLPQKQNRRRDDKSLEENYAKGLHGQRLKPLLFKHFF